MLSVCRDFAGPGAHADPVANRARLAGSSRTEVESDRAIDRPLLDRVAAEHAVLGADPCAGEPISLLPVGPGVDPELGTPFAADEEVTVALIGDHAPLARG